MASAPLCEGMRARVHSLRARSDLNESIATLLAWKATAGRWQCRIGADDSYTLLPENLSAVCEEPWILPSAVLSHELVAHIVSFLSVKSIAAAASTCRALANAVVGKPMLLWKRRVVKSPVMDAPWANALVVAMALIAERVCTLEVTGYRADHEQMERLACYDTRSSTLLPVWQKPGTGRLSASLVSDADSIYRLVLRSWTGTWDVIRYNADGVVTGRILVPGVIGDMTLKIRTPTFPWRTQTTTMLAPLHLPTILPHVICAHRTRLFIALTGSYLRSREEAADPSPSSGLIQQVAQGPVQDVDIETGTVPAALAGTAPAALAGTALAALASTAPAALADELVQEQEQEEEQEPEDANMLSLSDDDDTPPEGPPGRQRKVISADVVLSCALHMPESFRWTRLRGRVRDDRKTTELHAVGDELFIRRPHTSDVIALSLDGLKQRVVRMSGLRIGSLTHLPDQYAGTLTGLQMMDTGQCLVVVKHLQPVGLVRASTGASELSPKTAIEVYNQRGNLLAHAGFSLPGYGQTPWVTHGACAAASKDGVVMIAPSHFGIRTTNGPFGSIRASASCHLWEL